LRNKSCADIAAFGFGKRADRRVDQVREMSSDQPETGRSIRGIVDEALEKLGLRAAVLTTPRSSRSPRLVAHRNP